MKFLKIAMIPADGVGPEILAQVEKIVKSINRRFQIDIQTTEFPYGADYALRTGVSMPAEFVKDLESRFNAVMIGTLGDPRIPDGAHAREMIRQLREGLRLSLCLQTCKIYDRWITPLRSEEAETIDLLFCREMNEGLYSESGMLLNKGSEQAIAMQTSVYLKSDLLASLTTALEYFHKLGRKRVCLVLQKRYPLLVNDLWKEVFTDLAKGYPGIECTVKLLDSAIVQFYRNPGEFDVILTPDICGDVFSALGVYVQGGNGLAYLQEMDRESFSVFRIHQGSITKYAGHNAANPLGAILALQQLLLQSGFQQIADTLEQAVTSSIHKHWVTMDLQGIIGTAEVGDFICSFIEERGTLFESRS